MTLKGVSELTGAAYSTVAKYAQDAGWTKNGIQTLLDDRQANIIVEALKQAHGGGGHRDFSAFQTSLEGIEGVDSPAIRIELAHRKIDELHKQIEEELKAEIDRLKAENAVKDARIAEDAPKVEYHDRLVARNHLTNIRDTAKLLGMGQKEFVSRLKGTNFPMDYSWNNFGAGIYKILSLTDSDLGKSNHYSTDWRRKES
jgi:uncharacterized small protein (DUF1192 family)